MPECQEQDYWADKYYYCRTDKQPFSSMSSPDQSPGEFQALGDQLLMYNFAQQFEYSAVLQSKNNKQRPRNKQKPNLFLLNKNKLQKDGFFESHNHKQDNQKRVRGNVLKIGDATFKSNFECGNIETVNCTTSNTYHITLQSEINSGRKSIWFYFSCEGLRGQNTFIIQGFSKSSSLYNEGMKVCYRESASGNQWRRGGTKISYYQNETEGGQNTYELKFTFFFQNAAKNVVEFAYCFPYSFTRLLDFIYQAGNTVMVETLTKSFEGRTIPLITVGNLKSKDVIFVSARVHPGQTVSSLIMEGFIRELISESNFARMLRDNVLFKILPMINPDGVARGNYRFSAAGCDLNRKWKSCKPQRHPEIYYWKEYMKSMSKEKNVLMYIDLHGHSRKKNVFFYGCAKTENGRSETKSKQFPYLMEQIYSMAFKFDNCSFAVQKDKEGTARIAMWKELKIDHVYTCESTFCGAVGGGNYFESDYIKIGNKLCQGIATYFGTQWTEETDEKLQKIFAIKNKVKRDFEQKPQLRQMGMNGDSGSDSEPDAGENKGEAFNLNEQNHYRSSTRTYKATKKQTDEKVKIKRHSDSQSLNIETRFNFLKNQKTDAGDTDMANMIKRDIATAKEILQGHERRKSRLVNAQNQRIHSGGQRNTHLVFNSMRNKLTLQHFFSEPDNFLKLQEKPQISKEQSLRRRLMVDKGGAQYRRVKKMAEQFSRHNFLITQGDIEMPANPIVKGLSCVNNELQLQVLSNRRKTFTSSLNSRPQKSRKVSVDEYNRKVSKALQKGKKVHLNGGYFEVQCFGSRIPLRR